MFIYNNIFTGVGISRENKENFTDFIFGEDGAKIGREIETRKIASGKFPGELKNMRPEFVRYEADTKKVDDFVQMKITESKEELEETIEQQKKLIERLTKISDFAELPTLEYSKDTYSTLINRLMGMLDKIETSSYESVSSESQTLLQKQLECTNEAWLDKGTKYMQGDKCPFCTQDTSAVKSLIDAYRAIFNKNYDGYVENINEIISTVRQFLDQLVSVNFSVEFGKCSSIINKYLPFISELKQVSVVFDEKYERFQTAEGLIKDFILTSLKPKVESIITEKYANIHRKTIDTVNIDDMEEAINNVDFILSELCATIDECVTIINEKREEVARWTPSMVIDKKEKAEATITLSEIKMKRVEQDVQCELYKTKQKEQECFKQDTKRLQNDLEINQSSYLDTLFISINRWFKSLGSDGFELERKQSTKGNKTVYELVPLFQGKLIDNKDLSKAFSDSDRRNLALAIYFAHAEKSDAENTILVLDDPVVSFDDKRITKTCSELKRLAPMFEQIVILTHYKVLIRELLKNNTDAIYAKIEREGDDFKLACFNTDDYLLSDHERDYLSLASFACGNSSDANVFMRLRSFMESHINIVFQPELKKYGLSNAQLKVKIDGLLSNHVISGCIAEQLHIYRESLNSDHHTDSDDISIENNRTTTKDLLNYLYSQMWK